MENFIIIAVLVGIVAGAVCFLYRSKKKGAACIGCPSSGACKGKACSGCCSHGAEEQK